LADIDAQPTGARARQNPPRTIVLVRTHFVSEKLLDLLRVLKEGVGYDLRVCADETRGPVDLPRQLVLGHNAEMCSDLGLVDSFPYAPLFWYFGDYALYCAYHFVPCYDYYVMIEYDVEFVRGTADALERVISRLIPAEDPPYDLVATHFERTDASWFWTRTCERRFKDVYSIFFPLVVLSRRGLEYLYDWRKDEAANPCESGRHVFCEALVPSALMAAGGYRCADLNSLLPGSWHAQTFRCLPPVLLGALPRLRRGVEVVHPVYSEREYLRAELREAREKDTIAEFTAKLRDPHFPLSQELRGAFLRELTET
jgi:hypothetical protein